MTIPEKKYVIEPKVQNVLYKTKQPDTKFNYTYIILTVLAIFILFILFILFGKKRN